MCKEDNYFIFSRRLLAKMKKTCLIQYVVTKFTIQNGFLKVPYLVWYR